MDYLASSSILLVISSVILLGLFQKKDVFTLFTIGALDGLRTTLKIAPSIIGLVLMVTMLNKSGVFDFLANLLNPLCQRVGFPSEVLPLALIRPVSGSGALAVLDNILSQNGADTFAGRVASVMMGSTETTFYTIATYLGSANITKTGYTVPCALLADFVGIIMSVVTVYMFFG